MESKWKKYESMSPFEVKNELIEAAEKEKAEREKRGEVCRIYNAGRGNPDFLNTAVRKAFSVLTFFGSILSDSLTDIKDLGTRPKKEGIYDHFYKFIKNQNTKEALFLKELIDFAIKDFNFDKDNFLYSMVDAALGDFYPMPSRIFLHTEKIVRRYLKEILFLKEKEDRFDLFATEGAAAAMVYLFKSLKINKIVSPKDSIAIITPIFSPYLEMPELSDFDLVEVLLHSKEDLNWQVSNEELEKLKNPQIKAIYLVNPANPTSISMDNHVIETITDFVQNVRPDLIVLTDTVYATFVDQFSSFMDKIPKNTICVYSFSKYFGVTGWRLGVIMLDKDNVIDKKIASLSEKDKRELDLRYKTISVKPREIPFIERLELDSRDEALAHTGGLSGPQQAIMTLFSIFELMDKKKEYKKKVHFKLKKRISDFYENLKIPIPKEENNTYYYSLIDFRKVAFIKYGKEFANFLEKNINPLEFLFRLAKEKLTILLPGKGFAGPKWSIRISLANLCDESYSIIGKNVSEVMELFYQNWKHLH